MPLVIPIFIPHRGCPHQCLFCNQIKIAGGGIQSRDKDTIRATIEQWLQRSPGHKQIQVAFFGGSFTCLSTKEQVELLSAVQPFIACQQVDCIRISTRPDCIDGNTCELLRQYKVKIVELGVQSLTDSVLELSLRGHTSEQSRIAFSYLKAAGIQVGLQLMPGLPGETRRSFLAVVKKVVKMQPDFTRLYPVVVVKDSGLETMYREKRYHPLSLNMAIALTAKSYQMLQLAGIDVVRMGLQPTVTLNKNVIAGPYHPAFGELVLSRLWLKKIKTRLALLKPEEKLVLRISHRDQSALRGMRNKNMKRLEELGYGGRFTIVPDTTMARGNIEYAVC